MNVRQFHKSFCFKARKTFFISKWNKILPEFQWHGVSRACPAYLSIFPHVYFKFDVLSLSVTSEHSVPLPPPKKNAGAHGSCEA